jgi:NAD(P)-dependent dehydrogenase (short-subunit alcohol dehydrogenase family)
MQPSDKVVLVTGAARGIGAATARALAARGARLALVGLEPGHLAEVAAACGPHATWHVADVADADAMQAAVGAALAEHGRLDVVFANAGIAILGPLHRLRPGDVARQVEVNLLGAFNTARATTDALVASRGYLLFNASIAAVAGIPSLGPYAASKAGVDALAAVLRTEMHAHGVDVGVAYFGWVDTDLVRQDAHPDLRAVRSGAPGPLGRAIPVSQAVAAVLRAVEGRRRVVVAPPWLAPALPLRGVLRPLLDLVGRRYAPALERRWERAAAERGVHDASRPRGPSRAGTGERAAP